MRKVLASVALVAAVAAAPFVARAQGAGSGVLPHMAAQAASLQHDAAIYQWRRVNREVDRIEADLPRAEADMRDGSALRDVVAKIRAARLHHDVDALVTGGAELAKLVSTAAR